MSFSHHPSFIQGPLLLPSKCSQKKEIQGLGEKKRIKGLSSNFVLFFFFPNKIQVTYLIPHKSTD